MILVAEDHAPWREGIRVFWEVRRCDRANHIIVYFGPDAATAADVRDYLVARGTAAVVVQILFA